MRREWRLFEDFAELEVHNFQNLMNERCSVRLNLEQNQFVLDLAFRWVLRRLVGAAAKWALFRKVSG